MAPWLHAEDEGNEVLTVAGLVKVIHVAADSDSKKEGPDGVHGKVILEWVSGPLADCVADSVVSIILNEQGPPTAIGAAEQQREYALLLWTARLNLASLFRAMKKYRKHYRKQY